MTPYFLWILTSPSHTSVNITTSTMQCHLHPLGTLIMLASNFLAPQTSQHTMSRSFLIQSTNYMNISRSNARISRSAIHSDDGGASMRIGPTCTILHVTFFAFQVCHVLSYSHSYVYTFLGSAVAIEHIFSSSRDTILTCCASLWPETIHTLMVLKHHFYQMCEGNAINVA